MHKRIGREDLDHILQHTSPFWEAVRGSSLFITGGTGFFGRWLLESFLHANDQLSLGARSLVLSRSPASFAAAAPHVADHPAVTLLQGDVRAFDFPRGEYPFVIHAATAASARLNREDPLLMFQTIVEGTRQALEFARTHGTIRFLLTSSGAVYGPQPASVSLLTEEYAGAPDPMDPEAAYAEGKRAAETLCRLYAHQHGLGATIARCFAFVGPHLPLDAHYAVGNFIRDALQGGPIRVNGDGSPLRSYLYAADLAAWLWTVLLKGQACRPYNVGSDQSISIAGLAGLVRRVVNPGIEITVARQPDPSRPPQQYVPSVQRARAELGLDNWIPADDAIRRTVTWLSL